MTQVQILCKQPNKRDSQATKIVQGSKYIPLFDFDLCRGKFVQLDSPIETLGGIESKRAGYAADATSIEVKAITTSRKRTPMNDIQYR